ncbi:MAG: NUDIX domain-containing protein [Nanoarchaeota archaeon]|nr:NUDIX domain-containing protein [Nanoarchaeota archaeon]
MEPKLFVAMKAFILHNGKVLILRESSNYNDGAHSGKYDLVGGRVKPGQHFKESLLREITEETGLKVDLGRPFFVHEWRPQVKGEQWQIIGTFFECESASPQVILSEDHDHFQWIDPQRYRDYKIIETNFPVFEAYLDKMGEKK